MTGCGVSNSNDLSLDIFELGDFLSFGYCHFQNTTKFLIRSNKIIRDLMYIFYFLYYIRRGRLQTKYVLDVVVIQVKNLPLDINKDGNPFVKVRVQPGNKLWTSELQEHTLNYNTYVYTETFSFKLDERSNDELNLKHLDVSVCCGARTRRTPVCGETRISLADLKLNQPQIKWYKLVRPKGKATE